MSETYWDDVDQEAMRERLSAELGLSNHNIDALKHLLSRTRHLIYIWCGVTILFSGLLILLVMALSSGYEVISPPPVKPFLTSILVIVGFIIYSLVTKLIRLGSDLSIIKFSISRLEAAVMMANVSSVEPQKRLSGPVGRGSKRPKTTTDG